MPSAGSFLNWHPQKIEDFPIPQHPVEHEHHFIVRCLSDQKLKNWRKKYFRENAKAIGNWARKRYAMRDEEAFRRGKEKDFELAAKERGTWQWTSGLYGPETGRLGASRGGEPVKNEEDASGIIDRSMPPIQPIGNQPGQPVHYGKKDARGMGNTEATVDTDRPVMLAKEGGDPKVGKVLGEFKRGTLKSGSGQKVTDRQQALAIAMSEAGLSKPRHK